MLPPIQLAHGKAVDSMITGRIGREIEKVLVAEEVVGISRLGLKKVLRLRSGSIQNSIFMQWTMKKEKQETLRKIIKNFL